MLGAAAARDQAQRRHAGRRRDADREAVGLAQRDRGVARAVRQFPGAGVHRRGQGRGPALLRGRRRGGRGDAAAGARRATSAPTSIAAAAPRRSASRRPSRPTAVRAASVLGLGVAGVDLIRSDARPAGAGGQFLARAGGHRGRDRHRHRRADRRPRGVGPPARRPSPRSRRVKTVLRFFNGCIADAFNSGLIAPRVACPGPQFCLSQSIRQSGDSRLR